MNAAREEQTDDQIIIKVLMATFNRVEDTLNCLQSLFSSQLDSSIKIRVILVDAGSSDGTLDRVAALNKDIDSYSASPDHYWAMAMRKAWLIAQESSYDFLLWLNDDVTLSGNAIQQLVNTSQAEKSTNVVVGAVKSEETGKTTYSGYRTPSPTRRLQLQMLNPTNEVQRCDTLNGNVVLASSASDYAVDGFPKGYGHGLADIAYGFELTRKKIPILLMPDYVGTCERQIPLKLWLDPSVPINARLRALRGPKGLPIRTWSKFCIRYGGPLGVVNAVKPYAQTITLNVIGFRRKAS
ncbi:MAG: glycosyltransferase family 2 protein [Rhodococcus sp.]|nr:glycosyltransferase [Rhodococcus sp. (in: high G+C Gram-positive bacteria)]MBJ7323344.1 glycosyltransferase family 2 protein [Rhodococcus sp. (in: high G+C Gram-positive bacteria)]